MVVLMMSLLVTVLATTMLVMSNMERKLEVNSTDSDRALLASRAGLNYAYHLYSTEALIPTRAGTAFDSFDPAVSRPLEGAGFTGSVYDLSNGPTDGTVYRIVSVGTYEHSRRTTELVFKVVPAALQYGYFAFDSAVLQRHDTGSAGSFLINSTVFSNNVVNLGKGLTVDGSIVASGSVRIRGQAGSLGRVTGDVYAYSLANDGAISGKVKFLGSVEDTLGPPDIVDSQSNPYVWYSNRNNPDARAGGSGTIGGGVSRYLVHGSEAFHSSLVDGDGRLLSPPNLNVIKYIPPPKLDYAAMKLEADKNDPTYFTSSSEAFAYLASKKVTEIVGGQTVTTIKVGTASRPEFLYVRGDLNIKLDPAASSDNFSSGTLKADGLVIEGGLYATGNVFFNGRSFHDPESYPAGYNELTIDALPFGYPALIAYPEPASGSVASWTPDDTPPPKGGAAKIAMVSSGADYEGTILINGLTLSEGETHLHHIHSDKEVIRINGAKIGWKLIDCDYFRFTYDPAVANTRFLGGLHGAARTIAYREIRG